MGPTHMHTDPFAPATLPVHRWLPWLLAALALFSSSLLYPVFKDGAVALLILTWLPLLVSSRTGKTGWLDRWGQRLQASPGLQKGLLALSSVLFVAGGIELGAQILTRLDVLETDSPMITMLPEGSHDWRLAHITADRYREPDPVLFWRPVDRKPYTKQRFRGPVIEVRSLQRHLSHLLLRRFQHGRSHPRWRLGGASPRAARRESPWGVHL